MIHDVLVSIPEQPFLLILWIMACYTLVFVFLLELLATIWVVAAIRVKLHKLKVQKRKQTRELEHLQQQTMAQVQSNRITPSPTLSTSRRPMRRSSINQDGWN